MRRTLLSTLVLVGACAAGPAHETNATEPVGEPTAPTAAVESTMPVPEPTVSTASAESGPTTQADDSTVAESLVDAFVEFSQDPTEENFDDLPLAGSVDLGLGPSIVKAVEVEQLRRPEAWQLDVELFRAYVGPFSALDTLSGLEDYQVTVGDHPHCAAPPVPPPEGYDTRERISVQPELGPQDSCLMWATVDFFLLPSGEIAAITLDMWEP